jgi:ubiquinone/menaquinone biosynthesis C-methylase UbiE
MISVLGKEQNKKGRTSLLVRCDGEALPFKENVFDCVACIRFLHHHMPDEVRVRILREMRRVSRKWLIVQSQRLRFLGFRAIVKIGVRKLLGRKVRKHRFHKEATAAGWIGPHERSAERCLEVYRKE